jgi:hypothetical protein
MHLRVRLKRGDSSSVTMEVGPVIYLLHTLFTQGDVVIQNKNVTSSTGHYPYKAMIQTHLKYGKDAKNSQLSSQMWVDDRPSFVDDAKCQSGGNSGLSQRSVYFALGKAVDLQGNIFHLLFSMNRYLLNQV